jgi:hypothetical protein
VAVTLVRLRELQDAVDVTLDHSTRGEDAKDASGAAAAPAAGPADDSCGTTGGKPNYTFQANVSFAPHTPAGDGKVPHRLGGGS